MIAYPDLSPPHCAPTVPYSCPLPGSRRPYFGSFEKERVSFSLTPFNIPSAFFERRRPQNKEDLPSRMPQDLAASCLFSPYPLLAHTSLILPPISVLRAGLGAFHLP